MRDYELKEILCTEKKQSEFKDTLLNIIAIARHFQSTCLSDFGLCIINFQSSMK